MYVFKLVSIHNTFVYAVIDLSQFSPEQLLEPDRLDVIPACPFVETSNTSIDDELKKRKTSQYRYTSDN